MTRNGGSVSDEYVDVRKALGVSCNDQVRKMITHSEEFKQYVRVNKRR